MFNYYCLIRCEFAIPLKSTAADVHLSTADT